MTCVLRLLRDSANSHVTGTLKLSSYGKKEQGETPTAVIKIDEREVEVDLGELKKAVDVL